jgi:hypothetical protein
MRTSNKILLSVFLTAIFIYASIHIALYAKYKSGDFVTMKTVHHDEYITPHLTPVHYIVASGITNFSIIPSDTLRLEIEKGDTYGVRFTIAGDSLILHGDTTVTRNDSTKDIIRSSREVKLYLPASENITLDFCSVELHTADDSSKAKSYRFSILNETSLRLTYNDYENAKAKYINSIFIKADNSSSIEFAARTEIKEADLILNNSKFEDNNAQIGNLAIDADKSSEVKLSGANLQLLKSRK